MGGEQDPYRLCPLHRRQSPAHRHDFDALGLKIHFRDAYTTVEPCILDQIGHL